MRAVIIGAGLAGLAAADALRRAGADVEVVEARDRVGGRVWSVPFGESVIERGAEFILPGNPVLTDTADRFDLRLVRKGTLYGDRTPGGDAAPVSVTEVSAAAHRLASPAPGAATVEAALGEAGLDPRIADVIRARLEVSSGYPAADLRAEVLEEAGSAFGDFDTHTVAGGNARLAEALAEAVGDRRIRLSAPAAAVRWSATAVTVSTENDGPIEADAAVLAVPASVIDRIRFDPPLPAATAAALRAVRYGQAAKLFVGLRTPAPPSATLSVAERFWCYTQLGPDGHPAPFVAAFAGTAAALGRLDVAAGPDRWLEALAALRPDLELDRSAVLLATWSDDPWVRGAYAAPSAAAPLTGDEGLRPAGRLAFAGEYTAGPWHGTMEGALRSGLRAARDLLE